MIALNLLFGCIFHCFVLISHHQNLISTILFILSLGSVFILQTSRLIGGFAPKPPDRRAPILDSSILRASKSVFSQPQILFQYRSFVTKQVLGCKWAHSSPIYSLKPCFVPHFGVQAYTRQPVIVCSYEMLLRRISYDDRRSDKLTVGTGLHSSALPDPYFTFAPLKKSVEAP